MQYTTTNSYVWKDIPEVYYDLGMESQSNKKPAAMFQNHKVAKFGDIYYAPSYGTITSPIDFESKISAFGVTNGYTLPGGEVEVRFEFRKNLPSVDIEEDIFPYN